MAKHILIFSDGTGQMGGLRPDQTLSNVYKLYRAMRPGPTSPIDPGVQYAFYDPGLGAAAAGGGFRQRIHNRFSAALGTGIDENIIDCYVAIIANYEPGDRISLFGFSRGAYTVRSLANVMNLCGVPREDGDGHPVPRHGPHLRKIATDAVRYVYNHGAGKKRDRYEYQREKKALRFRKKYACEGIGADGESQGNVQPDFIGVFDTVASLTTRTASLIVSAIALSLVALVAYTAYQGWLWACMGTTLLAVFMLYRAARVWAGQFKYFFEDPERRIHLWNPLHWPAAIRAGHFANWNGSNYDEYVDREVGFLRHALSIDENRKRFPRVPWGRSEDIEWNNEQGNDAWMRQIWFAGNHSDIGGGYPEAESRLSDIPLAWMVEELKKALPDVIIRSDLLQTWPDSSGLQHDERKRFRLALPDWLRKITPGWMTWGHGPREPNDAATLHPSVVERFKYAHVPFLDEMKPYRPPNLKTHHRVGSFYTP
ncbi:DUF2235 domain-containing protein [Salinisphaera sp. T5B8]|uniref:DUF2235 domain-containing protein n=1 Tax=Salinisphaera sp. T5B8 TaxID=1304154 RepID=UPI00333E99C4